MPALANSRHEAFAQALAHGLSIAAAYAEAGYKPNRGNAHTLLKQNKCISKRVEEIQAEQLAIHQQAGCPSRYYAAGKAGSHKTTSCRLARARVVANVR